MHSKSTLRFPIDPQSTVGSTNGNGKKTACLLVRINGNTTMNAALIQLMSRIFTLATARLPHPAVDPPPLL